MNRPPTLASPVLIGIALLGSTVSVAAAQDPRGAGPGDAPSVDARVVVPVVGPVRSSLDLDAFDAFVDSLMTEWRVPGVAVGAIRDGEVVLAKGYGYRDLERELPMTERTLVPIGGITASFTATLLGMLVDEGVLDWDEPVRSYLPGFDLVDAYAARHATIRDLLTHRTGVPSHLGVWYHRDYDRAELVRRLRHLEPGASFRERVQPSPALFAAAAHAAERLTGRRWETLVRERVFEPLGMMRSNTSIPELEADADAAAPYRAWYGPRERIPRGTNPVLAPVSGIHSSVEELLRYLRFHLANGEYDGRRLLSRENARELRTPQVVTSARSPFPELGATALGLGLTVTSYRGRPMVRDGGTFNGFASELVWLPDDGIGVVVLTNLRRPVQPVPIAVARRLLDRLLGLEPVDWNARYRAVAGNGRRRRAALRARLEAERIEGTAPSRPLADYAGTYARPGYDPVEVRVADGGLELVSAIGRMPLEHYHHDVFRIPDDVWFPLPDPRVTFGMDRAGRIVRVGLPLEPALGEIVFERAEDPTRAAVNR